MQATLITCDRCVLPVQKPHRSIQCTIVIGKDTDPSGSGYQDEVKLLDLCDSCVGKLAQWAYDKGYFQ